MNSSEIMKSSLLSVFEREEIEVWTDPYNSIPLKLLTIIIYLIELWASTIMLIFVKYEINGLFGHYRTVINQLLSYGYGAVSKIIYKIDFTAHYTRQVTALIFIKIHRIICIKQALTKFGYYLTFEFTF